MCRKGRLRKEGVGGEYMISHFGFINILHIFAPTNQIFLPFRSV
jgi:hypothetical protein